MIKFEFIISKKEDIENWLKFIKEPVSYGNNWLKDYPKDFIDLFINKTDPQKKEIIVNYIDKYYTKKYLDKFYNSSKIFDKYNQKIINRLEKIHNRQFPVEKVIIKYNTFIACPYQYRKNQKWFGIFLSKRYINKGFIGVAVHELMHLFFHYYFWDICKSKGLKSDEIHFIKESFTVIINKEFKDILDYKDYGYLEHKTLRQIILKEWKKGTSFEEILKKIISEKKYI
jgi:hypothetical protein